jgi:hypothetical protein
MKPLEGMVDERRENGKGDKASANRNTKQTE